ncbi:hypothetical protein ACFL1T_01175 [Chlamydiota bacterium]
MRKNMFIIIMLTVITTYVFGLGDKENMIDSFGRGFAAAKEKKKDEALTHFINAGNQASKINEWQGCLDAANAIATMGDPLKGVQFIEAAFDMAKRNEDWRIAVACGYAFASLPEDMPQKVQGEDCFIYAGNVAAEKKDWIGLSEAANALINIKREPLALDFLDKAFTLAQNEKSIQGCNTLIGLFTRIGDAQRKEAVEKFKMSVLGQDAPIRPIVTPPTGWSPTGDSVATPKVPDKDIQLASRASADKEIQAKRDWEKQQEQIKLEKAKIEAEKMKYAPRYTYAGTYRSYYYFPYGNQTYRRWGWNRISTWSNYYLGNYTYSNGYYRYNRRYTGFGFNFGYRDRRSGTSFAFGIYDW